jgi:hypothetical protein
MGHSHDFKGASHNRLLLSLAHSFGHQVKTFGSAKHCGGGPLKLS